jgi:hypothetical protein
MAYGYKKIEYFMLKIMQRCGYLGKDWVPGFISKIWGLKKKRSSWD